MKIKTITIETEDGEVTLRCKHREDWPPAHARLPNSPDELRASGVITDAKYQQLQTWERVCGMMRMEAGKCSTCPLSQYQTETGQWALFAPDGKPQTRLPHFARAREGKDRR